MSVLTPHVRAFGVASLLMVVLLELNCPALPQEHPIQQEADPGSVIRLGLRCEFDSNVFDRMPSMIVKEYKSTEKKTSGKIMRDVRFHRHESQKMYYEGWQHSIAEYAIDSDIADDDMNGESEVLSPHGDSIIAEEFKMYGKGIEDCQAAIKNMSKKFGMSPVRFQCLVVYSPLRAGERERLLDAILLEEPQLIDKVRKAEVTFLNEMAGWPGGGVPEVPVGQAVPDRSSKGK